MIDTHAQAAPLVVGAPVIDMYGSRGVIGRVSEGPANVYTISAGGMKRQNQRLEVIFDERISDLSESIVQPWADRAQAARLPLVSGSEIETRRAAAIAAQNAAREAATRAQDAAAEREAAFLIEARQKMPADAKAVIVAELIEDRSDSMTDYWGSTTVRTVILAFSGHTRDLFPELRKAARNFAETLDLADAPEKAEHREKYSMGAGYYLKLGSRDSNGWKISKKRLYQGERSIPVGEWSLAPVSPARAPDQAASTSTGAKVEKHFHTKGGFDMWVVPMVERVDREEYERLLAAAKILGGWYSRAWKGTPAGFAFKFETAAAQFVQNLEGDAPTQSEAASPAVRAIAPGVADKLRTMADKLQGEIDDKFRHRLTNTPKRMREAQSARLDGLRLQRTQQAMRALAAHHEAKTVPDVLRSVTTKAAIFELCRARIETTGGYYDAGRDTGEPAADSPATRALWAMLSGPSETERRAAALREKVQSLQFANIPGYFPTPAAVVAQMLGRANIPAAGCRVLEPSAGSGAILDAVATASPGCTFLTFEQHCSLREILQAKGYTLTGSDFMESDTADQVERVLMNPPFERGQDIDHVRRAFAHLAPGGRLVAIMSQGPFYRSDRKAESFRQWFEAAGGEKVDIPAGAFKESGTEIPTALVIIDA